MRAEPGRGDALDLGDRVVDVGDRHGRGRREPIEVRREPLDDVVVVHARVRHRQLVVVGVEPEQRQVRVHHLRRRRRRGPCPRGSARGRPRASARRSGGTGRSSSPRSPGCAAGGRRGRRPRRAARSRSPPPRPPRSRRCFGRRVRKRSVGSRMCPSAETTKSLSVMRDLRVGKPTGRYMQSRARWRDAAVAKRWTQRPDGSTWGDWGDDDELGRINLLTPEKVLAGRARGRGRHQLLPQPAARLPGRHRAEPAAAPAGRSRRPRTWTATPTVFYNVHLSEMEKCGHPQVRRRVGRRRGDALRSSTRRSGTRSRTPAPSSTPTATGSRRPSSTTATAPASTSSGRRPTRAATAASTLRSRTTSASSTWRSTACRAAACSSTSRTTSATTGAASTAKTLEEIMAADDVVVEPGDMLLLHTGFATKVLEWNRDPDPVRDPRDVHVPRRARPGDARVDRRVADLGARRRQLRGRRDGRRATATTSRHSLLPIHHLCLFKLGVPLGELWYLHELAPGCASTTGAGSCSPRRRCACPASVGSPGRRRSRRSDADSPGGYGDAATPSVSAARNFGAPFS